MLVAAGKTDICLRVRGIVQGVGFRPFVHRTATGLGLRGWVRNDPQGVLLRAVGPATAVEQLALILRAHPPAAARVESVEEEPAPRDAAEASDDFRIVESAAGEGTVEAAMPPDLALCVECRTELLDPRDRRHCYPFINCTQCGPRYSIIESLPYDRPATTMRAFRMCPRCTREYDDPRDRRFHAQPNACPACGPSVSLTGRSGRVLETGDAAVRQAAGLIAAGAIVAVKGIGGYHLMAEATNANALTELRRRKQRDEKPLAVMFPDVAAVAEVAEVSTVARDLLESAAAPIVLVPRRPRVRLAPSVAPGNPWVGAMIAYSPLHVLLLRALNRPVVATSANLAEEPLCTDPDEAHARLANIADAFLDHNRPIAHPVDDSVIRLAGNEPILLRRARGYAPMPISLPAAIGGHWLCVGAQMKNVVAVAAGERVVLSPHLGDLAGAATLGIFRRTIDMLAQLQRVEFTGVVCDQHPDYASTRHALSLSLPCLQVQHHLAHVLACLLEHGRPADGVLGVSFDGTGYGEDGTIWGGEFLLLEKNVARRFGRLRPFRLPGGEAAVRDPRRVAFGLLRSMGDARSSTVAVALGLPGSDVVALGTMLDRGLNSPVTTSAGRLFDAVGALLGLGARNRFEGQVPLAVEAAATQATSVAKLQLPVRDAKPGDGVACEVDWRPLLEEILRQRERAPAAEMALGFHAALADAIVATAQRAGVGAVALSGGCFQNALLLERTMAALRGAGFEVLVHRVLPPNDGNIAAGQALAALWGLTSVAPF